MSTRNQLARLWQTSAPLTAVGLVLVALTPLLVAAMAIDRRVITGMPAWLKPAKFAISTGVFSLTLAWVLSLLPNWRRLGAVVGWMTALIFVMEVAIISLQAWRGTTSHFNVGTRLDGILFLTMGAGILLQTLLTAAVALALWVSRFDDRALGWALRLGVTLSIVGASTGVLMTRPTAEQLADARARGGRFVVNGAHSIGGPDGGPGIPGTGWSLQHGDLRVPHFVGLHAVQALPLVALLLARRRVDLARRVRAVLVASASHASLFAILLWQALRGQSIAGPDTGTVAVLGAWAAATVLAAGFVSRAAPSGPPDLHRRTA